MEQDTSTTGTPETDGTPAHHNTTESTAAGGGRDAGPATSPGMTATALDDAATFDQQVNDSWTHDLGRDERAAILSWGSFTATFALVRGLTHWLKDGHGPSSGGISIGGQHFHHYNLGIAGLAILGGLVVQAEARERIGEHPALPIAYGVSTALIADEAALLLDLKDVYWSKQGRTSVDIAVGTIGVGGFAVALTPLLTHVRKRRHR